MTTKKNIIQYKKAKDVLNTINNYVDIEEGIYVNYVFQSHLIRKYVDGYHKLWIENNKIHLKSENTGAEITFPGKHISYNTFLEAINKSGMQAPKWFDPMDYLMANRDLFDNLVDPVEHYLNHGIKEGRDPSPFFSEQKYLELNPDIKQGVENGHLVSGYMHYIEHGCREGRSPDGIFNEQKYLELNNDIYQGIQNGHLQCGFIHCIQHGLEEGRLGCADIYG